jgi:hypothetical protein
MRRRCGLCRELIGGYRLPKTPNCGNDSRSHCHTSGIRLHLPRSLMRISQPERPIASLFSPDGEYFPSSPSKDVSRPTVAHRLPLDVALMLTAAKEAKHDATNVDAKRKAQETQS